MTQQRKNFDRAYKINQATVKEETRPYLDLISFRNGYVYATDTHIIVKAKIKDISNFTDDELELLEGKSISSSSFRKLLDFDEVAITPTGFIANGGNGNKTNFLFNDQQIVDIKFDDVFVGLTDHYAEEKYLFGLNASLLKKASQILGVKGTMKFEIFKGEKFVVTDPNNVDVDIKCLIMGAYIA